jgi:hypothetical protein
LGADRLPSLSGSQAGRRLAYRLAGANTVRDPRSNSYQRAEVIVDPRIAFGLPLVVHGGARDVGKEKGDEPKLLDSHVLASWRRERSLDWLAVGGGRPRGQILASWIASCG